MSNSLLKQILREYDKKRNKAILEANKRKQELLNANPKLKEIDKELSLISIQTSKAILMADEKEREKLLNDLKKKTNSLIKEKNTFMKELSKTNNYLEPHFECSLCEDTGYVTKAGKTTHCTCLKQKIFDVAYNKSNMGNLEKENFANFNLRLFSDKPNKELYKSDISPRENIELIREKSLTFIENFDNPNEKNLIFTGSTGLGKTFMINCIANEALKLGKTVLYQTAPIMLDAIIDEKFGNSDENINLQENILTVDLLIIDDLGAERVNDFKITELFTIINSRLLNPKLKTIISSNLTIEELFKTYTNRIGSRLVGNYKFLRFFGEDLRFKKAKKEA